MFGLILLNSTVFTYWLAVVIISVAVATFIQPPATATTTAATTTATTPSQALTVTRKFFHVVVLLVFVPGLLHIPALHTQTSVHARYQITEEGEREEREEEWPRQIRTAYMN